MVQFDKQVFILCFAQVGSVIPLLNAHCLQELKAELAAAESWAEHRAAAARQNLEDLAKGLELQRNLVIATERVGAQAFLNQGRWKVLTGPTL